MLRLQAEVGPEPGLRPVMLQPLFDNNALMSRRQLLPLAAHTCAMD
jgi:hypothetical protein